MKKHFLNRALVYILSMLTTLLACSKGDEFTAELAMESDAMAIVNYYVQKRIVLTNQPLEPNLRLPDFQFSNPMFGTIVLGNSPDSVVALALDESAQVGVSYLYIDRNNNEDLTDDGDPSWDDQKNAYWTKEALIDVHYKDAKQKAAVPYPVTFYRYRDRYPDWIIAYRNGYREGYVTLKDSTYKVALLDDDLNGLFLEKGAIIIDINRDGHLAGNTDSPEYFSLHEPFNINGTTYAIKEISPAGDRITIAVADTQVLPKTVLSAGMRAPAIRAKTVHGDIIDLAEYRNQVVLLDFWATWCKPWEDRLPSLRRIYDRFHRQGFEIIGVNLDEDLDALAEFMISNQITWPQVSNGRGWEMPLVRSYRVNALPKSFLLDRNGFIRYKDLRGKNLSAKIYELLNEQETTN